MRQRQSSRGIRSSSSGQMNPARASARASARQSGRGTGRSGRGSQREPEPAPPARRGRKRGGGGTELAICLVIIAVLGIVCGVLWVKRSKEKQAEQQRRAAERKAEEENKDRAFQAFMKAQSIGHDFVTGKNTEVTREQLFSEIQGDPNIFNVLFEWSYKKRNQTHPVQHFLYDDNEHKNVKQTSRGFVKDGISFTHGYTNTDDPIMIATKLYPPPKDDKSNLGGQIMVIVRAVE